MKDNFELKFTSSDSKEKMIDVSGLLFSFPNQLISEKNLRGFKFGLLDVPI
jgi:hypothetical protein